MCTTFAQLGLDDSVVISNSSGLILSPIEGILVENPVEIKIAFDLMSNFTLPDDDLDKFHKNCLPKVEFQIKNFDLCSLENLRFLIFKTNLKFLIRKHQK